MANVGDVKDAIEGAIPGRPRRRGWLPKAGLVALVAAVAAGASRLAPVRAAARTMAGALRSRVSALTGRGAPGAAATDDVAAGSWPSEPVTVGDQAAGVGAGPDDMAASGLTDADMTSVEPPTTAFEEPPGDVPAATDAGMTIPADSEEGRPSGG